MADNFFCDQHYDAAVENMNPILEMQDSKTIDFLLLMAVYCLRAARSTRDWQVIPWCQTDQCSLSLRGGGKLRP